MNRDTPQDRSRIHTLVVGLFQSEIDLLVNKNSDSLINEMEVMLGAQSVIGTIISSKNTVFEITNSTNDACLTIKMGKVSTYQVRIQINLKEKRCYTMSKIG